MNTTSSSYQNTRLTATAQPSYSSFAVKIEHPEHKDYVAFDVYQSQETETTDECSTTHQDDDDDAPPSSLSPAITASWFHIFFTLFLGNTVQWLRQDSALYDELDKTVLERERRTVAACIRFWLYDPVAPQRNKIKNYYLMALCVGVAVGLRIVLFKQVVEWGLDFVWETVPEMLERWGVFGLLRLPSYLYVPMVVSTACVFCGVAFEKLNDMPDQNSLLQDLDQKGRISTKHLWPLVYLSITAMCCGLPLGPELPLLLIFAMFGSQVSDMLGLNKEQSRFMLYFSMSAAIGAFFHFPIGAFWFVVEVPHRMGVFHRMGRIHVELVGPCAMASLAATVTHCYLTGTPVERMFDLPRIPQDLSCAIPLVVLLAVYLGNGFGKFYLKVTMHCKKTVHGVPDALFPGAAATASDPLALSYDEQTEEVDYFSSELDRRSRDATARAQRRKLVAHGVTCWFVGLTISVVCLVFPHCFSWGEAQLQNIFDNGTTSLPFFGQDSPLVAPYATCMPTEDGLSTWCLTAIPLAKTLIIGLILGTGIRCGHFWGPAYGGAAVGQLAVHLLGLLGVTLPYTGIFLISVMASAHVVIFRSPLGIAFLLMQSAGYDIIASVAVMTAAHISLYISRDAIFYKAQKDHQPVFDICHTTDSATATKCSKCCPEDTLIKNKQKQLPKVSKSGYIELDC